jgi:hypothetical protein
MKGRTLQPERAHGWVVAETRADSGAGGSGRQWQLMVKERLNFPSEFGERLVAVADSRNLREATLGWLPACKRSK